MKLATLKDGSRDGRLVVVSRDLTRYQLVPKIAATLPDTKATTTLERAMEEPTERSMPPVMMMKVIPKAQRPTITDWVRMLRKFPPLRKLSLTSGTREKRRIMRINPRKGPNH